MDEDYVDMCRKKGINRLPALIDPEGKTFVGLRQITELFEKNLNRGRASARLDPISDAGDGGGLADFWKREMYNSDKNGNMVPRKDEEETDDESAAIERSMASYRKNTPMHHRGGEERDVEQPRRRERARYDRADDNIADESEDEAPPPPRNRARTNTPRLAPSEDGRDDLDQQMLTAWMENNGD
jgi:hypothetical protein